METNITQLKQEQIVGNEVVYEDVMPKTISSAVFDNNDIPLDELISRIWNSINNKLSRIVNSVNGRTGVVILNKTDVGLDKVDNVSYAEIKNWVIEQINSLFADKHMQLVDTLHQIDELCATNDKTLIGAPFYSSHGYNEDPLPYIGFIYWDKASEQLGHDQRVIRIPTAGDSSIIYDEIVGSKNYTNGKIGVNIAPDEDVLKIRENTDKSKGGLYIDKSKLGGAFITIPGMYGNGKPDDESAFLYYDPNTTPIDAPLVKIYIDGEQVNSQTTKLRYSGGLSVGMLILCNFNECREFVESKYNPDSWTTPEGMCLQLIHRQPAIGRVKTIPSEKAQIDYYEIEFWTIVNDPGWGLETMKDHLMYIPNPILSVKVAVGENQFLDKYPTVNLSGLQVFAAAPNDLDVNDPSTTLNDANNNEHQGAYYVAPSGVNKSKRSGVGIVTDYSLAVNPALWYGEGNADGATYENEQGVQRPYGSYRVANWAAPFPPIYGKEFKGHYIESIKEDMCPLGVNLDKIVKHTGRAEEYHEAAWAFTNCSGLRINKGTSTKSIVGTEAVGEAYGDKSYEWFGGNKGETMFNADSFEDGIKTGSYSGGISVNVGKFLEIEPGPIPENMDDYYDGGKVNVRIGNGLEPEPEEFDDNGNRTKGNRIQVKVDPERDDLGFDDNGNLIIKNFAPAMKKLVFTDAYGNQLEYNPTNVEVPDQAQETIQLGPGLKIIP